MRARLSGKCGKRLTGARDIWEGEAEYTVVGGGGDCVCLHRFIYAATVLCKSMGLRLPIFMHNRSSRASNTSVVPLTYAL